MGIRTALLSDPGNRVATLYGVMKWRMGNEPGHTFILVDRRGGIAWIRDYGAPQHGEIMYVDPKDLVPQIASHMP